MAKLDALQEQLARVQEQIAAEKKRLKQQEAKERKRKIAIIGAYYLNKSIKDGSVSTLAQELDKAGKLKKKADRALFGLADVTSQKPAESQKQA